MIAEATALPFDGRAALLAAAETFGRRTPSDARSTALARHCRTVAPFVVAFVARDVVRAYALASTLEIPCGGVAARIRAAGCRQIASVLGTRGADGGERRRAAEVWRVIVAGLELVPVDIDEERPYRAALATIYRRELHVLGQ